VREVPGSVAPCDAGGSAVEAGADLDLDGVLDPAEVDATAYACDVALAKVRLKPAVAEPAGPGCPTGGTAVGAFQDDDGDGAPDAHGFQTTLYVCQPSRPHDGDFVVTSAVDLAALEGVDRVRGSLRIEAPTLAEAVLPALAVVDGDLVVVGNSSLKRLTLGGLRFVGGSLQLQDNPRLDSLAVGDEARAVVRVSRALSVVNNPALPTLEGLAAVSPADSILLRGNSLLVEPGLLGHVLSLQGGLTVEDHPRMTRLPFFTQLTAVHGDVHVVGNPALVSLFGLPHVRTVGGALEVKLNPALIELKGAPELTSVGSLELVGNERLPSTSGLDALTRAGRLYIQGNPALVSVGDWPALAQVDTDLTLKFNPALRRVWHLPALRTLGALAAVGNETLESLEGLGRVTRMGSLGALGNAKLTSLSELGALRELETLNLQGNPTLTELGLPELARVNGDFVVVDNPKLATCRVNLLADRVFKGDEAARHVDTNDDAAACP
jgi:hypothetical protein